MTTQEHLAVWGRPITIDHIDKDRSHNIMNNLQTLCLRCHGKKDIVQQLTIPRVPVYYESMMQRRTDGATYQNIAHEFCFSIAAVWKWIKRWEKERLCLMKCK